MLGTIKLNTIKNRLNDFELKACVYISPNDELAIQHDDIEDKKNFSPYYYNYNKASFYILCSNKRSSSYRRFSYSPFNKYKGKEINLLLNACNVNNDSIRIYNLNLERFLIMQQNKDFLGWCPPDKTIDDNLNDLRGNKYCKHYKDVFYYGDNKYEVDKDKLYLFVRIWPKDCNNLTNLLINCTRDNIYNISDRSEIDKVGSLGFIVKLDNRYEYVYSKVFDKFTRIKYPFLTKKRINTLLFDDCESNYKIDKEIIYIKDNSKLDKYGIKVLTDF